MKKKRSGRGFPNALFKHESRSPPPVDRPHVVLNSYVDKGSVSFSATQSADFPNILSDVEAPERIIALDDDLAQCVNRVNHTSIVDSGQSEVLKHVQTLEDDAPRDDAPREEMARIVPDDSYVEYKTTLEDTPINTLQNYQLADDRDLMYFRQLHTDACVPDAVVSQMPQYKDILRYAQTLDGAENYYERITQMVVNTEGASFPQLEVINRRYIADFLRAPTHNDPTERPCGSEKCESLRLSASLLEKYPHMRKQGLEAGFRCRELILPNMYIKLLAEKKAKGAGVAAKYMDKIHQVCFLCHLHLTNRAYWLKLSKNHDREREGETPEELKEATMIIHRFVVPINIAGEYSLENMLVGDSEPMGIIGPFPRYNVNNYTPFQDSNGRCAWKESDKLVFQHPEQQSQLITSLETETLSNRSGHTTSHQRRTVSPK